jgi:mannose-6-phosphate isomerase-like protein (cupin superfamily)
LLSTFRFTEDWSTWEMHPRGEEVVMLLSGSATMVVEIDGSERRITLEEPGSYVVLPRGTWHRAETREPTTMLFVTPGEGTEHRPRV